MATKSSIYGALVQVDPNTGALYGGALGEVALTQPCADASITVGANIATVRQITVQLKDANGNAINYAETVEFLILNSAGTDFAATGGSTGLAIGASGKMLAIVAKKAFRAISTTAGVIALTWTDTAAEVTALAVRLPNGRVIVSSVLTAS